MKNPQFVPYRRSSCSKLMRCHLTDIMYSYHKCERRIDPQHPYVAVTSTRLKGNFIEMVCKCSSVPCLLITAKTVCFHKECVFMHSDGENEKAIIKRTRKKVFCDHKFRRQVSSVHFLQTSGNVNQKKKKRILSIYVSKLFLLEAAFFLNLQLVMREGLSSFRRDLNKLLRFAKIPKSAIKPQRFVYKLKHFS